MKRNFSVLAIALFVIFISGCSKDSGSSTITPPPLTAETWPQNWVLTIDNDPQFYKYLHRVGIVINRNLVDKTYSMTALANEKDCNWQVKSEGQRNGKAVYSFHLVTNKSVRWSIGKTFSPFGDAQWYLGTHQGSTPPGTDDWLFFIHSMPKQNGNKTVAIESVSQPGWFLDNIGHTLTANGVQLMYYDDPEKAVRFERH